MPRKGTHIKAIVLLIVFSLNTVVSFACSLGGLFHSFHHHPSSATATEERGHHHHEEGHHHDQSNTAHHHEEHAPDKPADDCCSKNVVPLDKVEKAASRAIEAPDAAFLTSFLITYSSLFLQLPTEDKTVYPGYVRWRIPSTIQDLRIVIQSFQI